jgi:hypothetical protein
MSACNVSYTHIALVSIRIVCIFLLTFTIVHWYVFRRHAEIAVIPKERFQNPVDFIKYMNRNDFISVIARSSFFRGMTAIDMIARKVPQIQPSNYNKHYISSIEEFLDKDMKVIGDAVVIANKHFARFLGLVPSPWKFVKVNSNIENGYPHTLGDVIVISDALLPHNGNKHEIAKTLMHETMHVLQRKQPNVFRALITELGFRTVQDEETKKIRPDVINLLRNNPDLDSNMYIHIKTSLILGRLYNSTNPSSLADSRDFFISLKPENQPIHASNKTIGLPSSFYCQLEHPYEIIACLVSEILTNEEFREKEKENVYVQKTIKWLQDNFA